MYITDLIPRRVALLGALAMAVTVVVAWIGWRALGPSGAPADGAFAVIAGVATAVLGAAWVSGRPRPRVYVTERLEADGWHLHLMASTEAERLVDMTPLRVTLRQLEGRLNAATLPR